jgi:hypothetical protein
LGAGCACCDAGDIGDRAVASDAALRESAMAMERRVWRLKCQECEGIGGDCRECDGLGYFEMDAIDHPPKNEERRLYVVINDIMPGE